MPVFLLLLALLELLGLLVFRALRVLLLSLASLVLLDLQKNIINPLIDNLKSRGASASKKHFINDLSQSNGTPPPMERQLFP